MTLIIDAHCHLEDERYDNIRRQIIDDFRKDGIVCLINPACDEKTTRRAVALARQEERVYACVGTHPHEAKFYDEDLRYLYEAYLETEDKLVAVGEIGLDYHYEFSPRKAQKEAFESQLQLAKDMNMPVVVHSREAGKDTADILKNFGDSIKVLLHSYSEDVGAWEYLAKFGYYISLGGMVTFKNADKPKALARAVPADRLLLETDGPYLAPVPYRGKINLPKYAHESLAEIAKLRGDDLEELGRQVLKNTLAFYNLEAKSLGLKADFTGILC